MIIFENEDQEYLKWLQNHEHGYVLNRRDKPDNFMVHTSRCMHINYKDDGSTRTVERNKMCSDRLEELQKWAKKKGFTVDECPTCRPYT